MAYEPSPYKKTGLSPRGRDKVKKPPKQEFPGVNDLNKNRCAGRKNPGNGFIFRTKAQEY